MSEIDKLEELFKNGFILKDEYDTRKSALQSESSTENKSETQQAVVEGEPKKEGDAAKPPEIPDEYAWVQGSQHFVQLLQMLNSEDLGVQISATTKVRKLLSAEKNPPIQEMIDQGAVPILVKHLADVAHPVLQFEAAWALTNIASGSTSSTTAVMKSGAIPAFIDLLSSPSEDVREQSIWGLGNIAGDSAKARDVVLNHGVLPPLIAELTTATKTTILRNGTWTLSNLCRGKPIPSYEKLKPALEVLTTKLFLHTDDEVLTDACWALSYLSDGSNDKIQDILDTGIGPRLVELMMSTKPSIQTPALRTVGNIVTGDDYQTQIMLNLNVAQRLCTILTDPKTKRSVRKETIWAISNITAGNNVQIQAMIDAGIFPPLIPFLTSTDPEIRKEAAWAIGNAITGGRPEQIQYFITLGALPAICTLLSDDDPRTIQVALEALSGVLKSGETIANNSQDGINPYTTQVEELGALDTLENLQGHANNAIYEDAVRILENYFGAEEIGGSEHA